MKLPLVLDIGMFDGADTEYYLDTGHRVVAVEANPTLVALATDRYADAVRRGQLTILNVAISATNAPVTLAVSGFDLGRSSTVHGRLDAREIAGTYTVPGLTMRDLIAQYPERARLIKFDIEGADASCLAAITRENRPDALSWEVGEEGVSAILPSLLAVGYTRFKLIDQTTLRELSRRPYLPDRIAKRLLRYMGMAKPQLVRRGNYWFKPIHSSGPAPWESDGPWRTAEDVSRQYAAFKSSGDTQLWLDLHAM